VDQQRERLRELGARLVRLHKLLLERERRAYEARHGSLAPAELLRVLLHDGQFAWLRALSKMMAQVDEVADTDGPISDDDAQSVFRETYRLLKSGARGPFQDKYLDALQESPDVVMAHADVSEVLRESLRR
jgi:hypothetical protein